MSMQARSDGLDRRTFLKTVGVTAGAGAVGTTAVEDADALLGTLAVGAGALIVGGTAGWAARELELIGTDDPPEGLTSGALKQGTYETARARKSTNSSTFIDNRNIVNYLPETAFSEAKAAAFEALNNGKSKSEVEAAAKSAAQSHYATVEKNVLKSWNESVNEFGNMISTLQGHPDLNYEDVLDADGSGVDVSHPDGGVTYSMFQDVKLGDPRSATLSDGSSFDVQRARASTVWKAGADENVYARVVWDPQEATPSKPVDNTYNQEASVSVADPDIHVNNPDGSNITYLKDWSDVWSDIQSQFDQIDSDIVTWVDNTYGSVQSGEIDTTDLVTGTDLANMGDIPRAVADLAASNIPMDIDNQLTIETSDGSTLSGYLATTDANALSTVAPGDTIDPNVTDSNSNPLYGTIYMAHDVAEWQYDWTHYDSSKGVDGGTVWFSENPQKSVPGVDGDLTIWHTIETSAGETVSVKGSNAVETTDGSGSTVWEFDLSDQLDTTIADISSVTTELEANIYTVARIDQSFEVLSTESGGDVTLEQDREPQTDTNYITQEEWDAQQAQQEELIQRFEDAKSSGGIGALWGGGGLSGLLSGDTLMLIGGGLLGLAGINAASS